MRLMHQLFNSNVLSILFYASECRKINIRLEKRILAFENMSLRRILNASWQKKLHILFIIIMDYALRFGSGYGVKVNNKQLFDLDLADDVVLLENSKERLQQLVHIAEEH